MPRSQHRSSVGSSAQPPSKPEILFQASISVISLIAVYSLLVIPQDKYHNDLFHILFVNRLSVGYFFNVRQ